MKLWNLLTKFEIYIFINYPDIINFFFILSYFQYNYSRSLYNKLFLIENIDKVDNFIGMEIPTSDSFY